MWYHADLLLLLQKYSYPSEQADHALARLQQSLLHEQKQGKIDQVEIVSSL
jgi:hypothetical protein